MNSFNEEVCEFNSTPVTENFETCEDKGGFTVGKNQCSSGCGYRNGMAFFCI
jgi:hypothetical protein